MDRSDSAYPAAAMKPTLNALALTLWLVWAGFLFLDELSSGFGGASAPTYGEMGVAVVIVVFLAGLGSVIASRVTEGPRGTVLAALPFVFVVVGHGFLVARRGPARGEWDEPRGGRASVVRARFDELPADFTYRGELAGDVELASILVIDAETGSLARVDLEELSIVTYCLGTLEGDTLRLVGELDLDLHDYVDASGGTIYDRFTVVTDPAGPRTDCHPERYDF